MYLDITIYVFLRVHRAIVFISILIIIVLHTYLVQSSLFYIYLQEDRRLLLSTTSLRYAAWSWIERYRSAEELFCCHIFGGKFPLLIVVVFLSHITRWAASSCRRAKVWSITQFYYLLPFYIQGSVWKTGGQARFWNFLSVIFDGVLGPSRLPLEFWKTVWGKVLGSGRALFSQKAFQGFDNETKLAKSMLCENRLWKWRYCPDLMLTHNTTESIWNSWQRFSTTSLS